jgi:anti-sigma regulatory factor (Ser/Thr protein kinase)
MRLPAADAPEAAAGVFVSVHELEATATAPAQARREVRRVLETWGLLDLIETTNLLVSELVTNAVRATAALNGRARRMVAVRISWAAASLIIEVWDRNPKPPVLRTPHLDAEGGRGLHIVEALSLAAAYYPSPTGQGKVAWCQIEAPTSAGVEPPAPDLPHRRPTVARTDTTRVFDDLAVLERVLSGLQNLDAHLPRSGP